MSRYHRVHVLIIPESPEKSTPKATVCAWRCTIRVPSRNQRRWICRCGASWDRSVEQAIGFNPTQKGKRDVRATRSRSSREPSYSEDRWSTEQRRLSLWFELMVSDAERRSEEGSNAPWWKSSLGSVHLYGLNCHSCPVVITHTTRSLRRTLDQLEIGRAHV